MSTRGQFSTGGTIRDESISYSSLITSPHSDTSGYITLSTESVKHEDGSTFSNSPTGEIDAGSSKSSLISTKITNPINTESNIPDTDQSNSHMYSYYTTESTINTYIPENAPQCHCTTPKYIIFLAAIPETLLISSVILIVIVAVFKRARISRRPSARRPSRRPIVRDLGSLQMTCVVNESNVEGIEMQER